MKKTLFIKNTLVLTVTSLILRTIGIVFRIYLSGTIGPEGMGLYQLVVSVYVLASTFAVSGITVAVTRLVADELVRGTARSVRHVLRRSLLIGALGGIGSALLFFFGAEAIGSYAIGDVRAVSALKMMAFSLPSMGISACLKGYFSARRKVGYPAVAQLIEQVVRIALIFCLFRHFSAESLEKACVIVMIGDTVAEWASCLFVIACYLRDRGTLKRENLLSSAIPARTGVTRQLLTIAAPITAGRYLNSGLRTIETALVPARIARFCGSRETALAQFGALKGMALPLLFFPASFLSAMSSLLIPELSAAAVQGDRGGIRRMVDKSLRVTATASLLIAAIFTVFAEEIGLWLYNSRDVGVYLRVLAPLTPVMYADSIADGMLKGLNQQLRSLTYSVTDSAVRIVLIWLIVSRQGMGGFLFIMVISNLLTSYLNLHRLMTVTDLKPRWSALIVKPLMAVAGASAAAILATTLLKTSSLSPVVSVIIGATILCVVYGLLLHLLGCAIPLDIPLKKGYDR